MSSRLALVDARAGASLMLVERALDWYVDEAATAQTPPISGDDARALRVALGGGPWRTELFDRLMTFGQAMFRLTQLGHGPGGTVGDAITALATVDVAGVPPWQFDPTIDPESFARFEFRETSVGIEKAQRDNREGWWAHAQRNRAFITDAIKAVPSRKLAVVLGAGSPFDLPLQDIARQFERVRLIDIDGEALAATVKNVWKDPADRARIETRVLDLTGINGQLLRRVDEVLATPASRPEEVEAQMMGLCRSYRLGILPQWNDPGERADFIVSSCVITQLAWPQRTYAEAGFTKRFGSLSGAADERWSTAWTELSLRVQQDHINALGEAAQTVVLTSDVISHRTALDPGGTERDLGKQILPLGVGSLLERIPTFYQIGRHGQWVWSRYRPTRRGTEGSRMDVEGVVLTARGPAVSPGGLWLP